MLDDTDIERILVVTAHPDDVDFGAGGTVAAATTAGITVTYCIITDGDAGGSDHEVPRSEIPAIRRSEQRAAGEILGVHDVRFLGYTDGELTVTHELRRDISRIIRQVRPQRMLIQSPDRNWDRIYGSHPDHLAAGEAAICAVFKFDTWSVVSATTCAVVIAATCAVFMFSTWSVVNVTT